MAMGTSQVEDKARGPEGIVLTISQPANELLPVPSAFPLSFASNLLKSRLRD